MRFSIGGGSGKKKPFEVLPGVQSETNSFERKDPAELEAALKYSFHERSLLEMALTHRSIQARGEKNDYERLEFLGDAVLDLAVAKLLLDAYPEAREGELSKMRAALVNTISLAEVAQTLELGAYIRLSRGEYASGGYQRPSILADVLEALMGAIFKEAGYETAFACIRTLFGTRLQNVDPKDPKTELQEALHAAGCGAPEYLLECVEGPEHAPTFVSIVKVDGQVVGRGRGNTKKSSQQVAASEALSRLIGKDEIDKIFLVNAENSKDGEAEQQ